MVASGSNNTALPDHNKKLAMYTHEPNLYKLIIRSKATRAEAFADWFCSEVLPPIRKAVPYITKYRTIEEFGLTDNKEQAITKYTLLENEKVCGKKTNTYSYN